MVSLSLCGNKGSECFSQQQSLDDIGDKTTSRGHALTLTTFLFPFWAPPAADPAPGNIPALSCAFIPAFTVSINTPVGNAGEYGDTWFASGGCGSGGIGTRRPLGLTAGADLTAFDEGDLPFVVDLVGIAVVCLGAAKVYGGLGILSGLRRWIWSDIFSNSCFSVHNTNQSRIDQRD
jgi:hypothetical protein